MYRLSYRFIASFYQPVNSLCVLAFWPLLSFSQSGLSMQTVASFSCFHSPVECPAGFHCAVRISWISVLLGFLSFTPDPSPNHKRQKQQKDLT